MSSWPDMRAGLFDFMAVTKDRSIRPFYASARRSDEGLHVRVAHPDGTLREELVSWAVIDASPRTADQLLRCAVHRVRWACVEARAVAREAARAQPREGGPDPMPHGPATHGIECGAVRDGVRCRREASVFFTSPDPPHYEAMCPQCRSISDPRMRRKDEISYEEAVVLSVMEPRSRPS